MQDLFGFASVLADFWAGAEDFDMRPFDVLECFVMSSKYAHVTVWLCIYPGI